MKIELYCVIEKAVCRIIKDPQRAGAKLHNMNGVFSGPVPTWIAGETIEQISWHMCGFTRKIYTDLDECVQDNIEILL